MTTILSASGVLGMAPFGSLQLTEAHHSGGGAWAEWCKGSRYQFHNQFSCPSAPWIHQGQQCQRYLPKSSSIDSLCGVGRLGPDVWFCWGMRIIFTTSLTWAWRPQILATRPISLEKCIRHWISLANGQSHFTLTFQFAWTCQLSLLKWEVF